MLESSIKVILLGGSGTGKTNIIKALVDRPFDESSNSTLTSSFISKKININNREYHLELWDTAGQEIYRSLTKLFLVDSKIVIFVYDITQKSTFEELDFWIKTTKDNLGDTPIYAIFGNKKDLYIDEQVEEQEGKKKAEELEAYFKLTSAKTERDFISKYIVDLTEQYIKKYGKNNIEEQSHREVSFSLQYKDKGKKKVTCCK